MANGEMRMEIALPTLCGADGYEMWRFQLVAYLRHADLWEAKLEEGLLGNNFTPSDAEKKQLNQIYAVIVSRLGPKPLVLVQQFGCTSTLAVLKKLDSEYRQDNLSARQQLLLDLVGRQKNTDESISDFIGSKWSLAKQRLTMVTVDELILLGITTCLPAEYNTVCSELRSMSNLTFDIVQKRLTEFTASLNSNTKELTGNTIALVASTSSNSGSTNSVKPNNTIEKTNDTNSTKSSKEDKQTQKLLKQVKALKGAVFSPGGGKGKGFRGNNNKGGWKGQGNGWNNNYRGGWRGHPYQRNDDAKGGDWNGWQEDWQHKQSKKGGGKRGKQQ